MSPFELKKDAVFHFSSLSLLLLTLDVLEFVHRSGLVFFLVMDHYMPPIAEHISLSTNEAEDDIDVSSVSDFSGDDHLNRRLVTDTSVTR